MSTRLAAKARHLPALVQVIPCRKAIRALAGRIGEMTIGTEQPTAARGCMRRDTRRGKEKLGARKAVH